MYSIFKLRYRHTGFLILKPSPSAPYIPDRVPATPTNTHISQTQTTVITTQPQPISQSLVFSETSSPVTDSNDETLTTPTTQDTSSILNR